MIDQQEINDKLAFLFPGQGSQSVGMGFDLYNASVIAKDVFDEVDDALGRKLSQIIFEGPEDELKKTTNAQPAIMAASIASYRFVKDARKQIPKPVFLAGHSLGEFTSLVASGVLDLSETARLVQKRGELMQKACELRPGGMAAVLGLDAVTLSEISSQTGTYVSNINTENQIVISGEKKHVAMALDMAMARGARKVIPLKVAGAFHSDLMEPAREGLINAISVMDFGEPTIPIVGNTNFQRLDTSEQIKSELVNQLCNCVNWKQSIDYMIDSGVSKFIEFGPGKALAAMVRRINPDCKISSVDSIQSVEKLEV
jgi:[acyl-carrier-protein] S-malonyltransferase